MDRRHFLTLSAAGTVLAAAGCAPMPRSNPLSRAMATSLTFSDITVSASGAAFENRRAAGYSSRVAPELEAVLKQRFAKRMNPGSAARIEVELARLNVADSARTAFGSDQSALSGTVRVISAGGGVLASYVIEARAGEAAETRTGALFDAAVRSSDGYYRQLLDAFARQAHDRITA